MELSIVILNYNTPLLTINCIKSLFRHHKKEFSSHKYEIILVDNKSPDDSVHKLEKEIKKRNWKISLIKSNKNTGFGGGNNLGGKKAKGKYLMFLNSDTVVTDKSLAKMPEFMNKHNDADILGAKLIYKNGKPQGDCGVSPNFYHALMILAGLGKDILVRRPTKIQRVDWVLGASMMFRRSVFNKLKGFDEKIFMYFEEVELCYRAKKSGFKIFYYPYTKITHLGGKSSNRNFITKYSYIGYLYFCKKHKNKFEYLFLRFLFTIKFKIYYLVGKLTGNESFASIYSQI